MTRRTKLIRQNFFCLISPKTAETYRTELMEELDIHDIASLTRYALRMGIVALDA
jgi:DNA-binding NarL/FixJ family response regulator